MNEIYQWTKNISHYILRTNGILFRFKWPALFAYVRAKSISPYYLPIQLFYLLLFTNLTLTLRSLHFIIKCYSITNIRPWLPLICSVMLSSNPFLYIENFNIIWWNFIWSKGCNSKWWRISGKSHQRMLWFCTDWLNFIRLRTLKRNFPCLLELIYDIWYIWYRDVNESSQFYVFILFCKPLENKTVNE